MNKMMTMMMTAMFVAVAAAPLASAHIGHAAPGHQVTGGSSFDAGWYWGQRLCVDTTLLTVVPSDGQGNCAAGTQPVPPFRGLGLGLGDCTDVDGLLGLNLDLTPRLGGPLDVTIEWGIASIGSLASGNANAGSTYGVGVAGTYADFYAEAGAAPNPTGANAPWYPALVAATAGPVQLTINQLGLGLDATGTSTTILPDVDFGDNDFEFGRGIACHTYAIDSGANKAGHNAGAAGPGPAGVIVGAGSGLNDPLCIGLDGQYDVAQVQPLKCLANSPHANVNRAVAGVLVPGDGFLVDPVLRLTGTAPITYSVCVAVAAGCTNIPEAGLGARFGVPTTDPVYSSLQDCVYLGPDVGYGGVAAIWGTAIPSGQVCWPERLATLGGGIGLAGQLYVPESQAAGGAFNPDWFPASPDSIESATVFFTGGGTQPFIGSCPLTGGVGPNCTGIISNPTTWVFGEWISGFSAVIP